MAIFNSQQINTDPHPWVSWRSAGSPFEMRWSVEDPDQDELTKNVYRPRAEYGNNPNPLLVAYRESLGSSAFDSDLSGWGVWLAFAREEMLKDGRCEPCHYSHAKKVLTRLANITQEGN